MREAPFLRCASLWSSRWVFNSVNRCPVARISSWATVHTRGEPAPGYLDGLKGVSLETRQTRTCQVANSAACCRNCTYVSQKVSEWISLKIDLKITALYITSSEE